MTTARYDHIGQGYARTRRCDARLRELIDHALGDAALAVLTVHHWHPDTEMGVRELRRVARGPVVIVTFATDVSEQLWMIRDYLPEVAEQDRHDFPSLEQLGHWLGPGTLRVEPVPVFRDTPDWTFASLWAHPERALDPEVTAGTSGFARLAPDVRARATAALERDLAAGEWDRRHGHLRSLDRLDAGQRLLVHRPAEAVGEEAREQT